MFLNKCHIYVDYFLSVLWYVFSKYSCIEISCDKFHVPLYGLVCSETDLANLHIEPADSAIGLGRLPVAIFQTIS